MHTFQFYDIGKELFSSPVYPGDPMPEKKPFLSIGKGFGCNLTLVSMGSHSGTHLDAPRHFLEHGASVAEIPLEKTMGMCRVVEALGPLEAKQVQEWLAEGTAKLLIKGEIIVTPEAAAVFAQAKFDLLGVEGQTVGDKEHQDEVHRILLRAGVVILEGLVLEEQKEGSYFLAAQPLKMDGLDGSPVRPVLISIGK